MKKTIIKFFILAVLFINFAFAQQKPGANELDKLYTPANSSVFNTENKSEDGGGNNYTDAKHFIRFNPTLLLRNMAALSWEFKFSEGVSALTGLGFCFNKDKVQTLTIRDMELGGEPKSSLKLSEVLSNGDFTSGSNLFWDIAIRFYFGGYNYNVYSGYVELYTRYTSTSLEIKSLGENDYEQIDAGSTDVSVRNWGFYLNYGYQGTTEGRFPTSHDFYFGTGVKSSSFDQFYGEERTVQGQDVTYHVKSGKRESTLYFSMLLGYTLGIGFKK